MDAAKETDPLAKEQRRQKQIFPRPSLLKLRFCPWEETREPSPTDLLLCCAGGGGESLPLAPPANRKLERTRPPLPKAGVGCQDRELCKHLPGLGRPHACMQAPSASQGPMQAGRQAGVWESAWLTRRKNGVVVVVRGRCTAPCASRGRCSPTPGSSQRFCGRFVAGGGRRRDEAAGRAGEHARRRQALEPEPGPEPGSGRA